MKKKLHLLLALVVMLPFSLKAVEYKNVYGVTYKCYYAGTDIGYEA